MRPDSARSRSPKQAPGWVHPRWWAGARARPGQPANASDEGGLESSGVRSPAEFAGPPLQIRPRGPSVTIGGGHQTSVEGFRIRCVSRSRFLSVSPRGRVQQATRRHDDGRDQEQADPRPEHNGEFRTARPVRQPGHEFPIPTSNAMTTGLGSPSWSSS
jgi:hypothetical protein